MHNVANGDSYLGLASRAEELNVGEGSQAELDVSTRAGFSASDQDTGWRVLPLGRDAIGVFYCPSRLGHKTLVGGGSYPFAEKLSVYSAPPAEWATGNFTGECYPLAEKQSVYSAAQVDWTTGHFLGGGFLPLCRETVGVTYRTHPADWAISFRA